MTLSAPPLACLRPPPSEGPKWPEVAVTRAKSCLSDRQQHGATGPLSGNHGNVSNQAAPVRRGSQATSLINDSHI